MSDTADKTSMEESQEMAIRQVANALHRLNDAVISAVSKGVTVELMRASRYHNEEGAWGDMLVPIIHKQDQQACRGRAMTKKIPTPKLATSDVCDAMGTAAKFLPVRMRDFGGNLDFAGPAVTVRTLDDNSKVKALVETKGEGRVLVVDGDGSERTSLMGGNLAAMAAKNGWAGAVIYGCVRDTHELCREDVGIKALGTCPRKTEKLGRGEVDCEIAIAGVTIHPGDWVVADADGIVITKELPSLENGNS